MAENWEIDKRHGQSLERLEQNHRNALERQRINEERRQREKREAVIIEGENADFLMRLKHDLDKENRLLDHAFQRAEDSREVERLATEIAMRRRDDYIRHMWEAEDGLFVLEAKVIEALTNHIMGEKASKLDHAQRMEAKSADHSNTMEFETHKTNEEIRKERAMLELDREFGRREKAQINEILDTLNKSEKLI